MIRLLTKISVPIVGPYRQNLKYSFVIFNLLKKHLNQREKMQRPKAQTYSASQQESKKKQEQQYQIYDTDYDFFSRQKEIQLNKDYRKAREQSVFIPHDIGKGGFEEVLYWSEFAKTPEQIIDIVKIFNRVKIPDQINDKIRFETFLDSVMKTVYLSPDFDTLQEFATFGERYNITQTSYWQKIEEKVIRVTPKNHIEAKDCIQIAFIMSKMGQGQLIYSSLFTMFKGMQISAEDRAKLLLAYANTQTGEKLWIQSLINNLVENLKDVRKQVFIEVLKVFQKTKQLSPYDQKLILERIEQILPEFNFRQLCLVGSFVGHGKMSQSFWKKLQQIIIPQIPKTKPKYTALHLLELLSSYSMSTEFTKFYLLPLLRNNNYELINQLPPEILSAISKTLFIFELESEGKDIEELIQTRIMKVFNNLKNVQVDNLIKVIKDYTVTRNGSRELYIFLEQVTDAMLVEIAKKRQHLETLCALYENSQLCSPEFLTKLQFNL